MDSRILVLCLVALSANPLQAQDFSVNLSDLTDSALTAFLEYIASVGVDVTDVDECDTLIFPCHQYANCTNTHGSFICTCLPGFDDEALVEEDAGLNCTDIDECLTVPCNLTTSYCLNVPGSYYCPCRPGFEFVVDGESGYCENHDECNNSSLTSCPDVNSYCVDTFGSFECPCSDGYVKVDGVCVDIDECVESNACDASSSSCVNIPASYYCDCNTGYATTADIIEDNKECIDIDECTEFNETCLIETSDPNKECTNTVGSFTCTCITRFVENIEGVCEEVFECDHFNDITSALWPLQGSTERTGFDNVALSDIVAATSSDSYSVVPTDQNSLFQIFAAFDQTILAGLVQYLPCDYAASCTIGDESYQCTCDEGFTGDGFQCLDIDECSTDVHNCDRTAGQCINTIGSYTCKCNDGYVGNGYAGNCSDVDECLVTNYAGLHGIRDRYLPYFLALTFEVTQPSGGLCAGHLVPSDCGGSCFATCEFQICPFVCAPGCACPVGYLRRSSTSPWCIKQTDCPVPTTTTASATASLSPTFVPSTEAFYVGSSFEESGPGGPPGEGDEPADFSEPESDPGDAPGEGPPLRRRKRIIAPGDFIEVSGSGEIVVEYSEVPDPSTTSDTISLPDISIVSVLTTAFERLTDLHADNFYLQEQAVEDVIQQFKEDVKAVITPSDAVDPTKPIHISVVKAVFNRFVELIESADIDPETLVDRIETQIQQFLDAAASTEDGGSGSGDAPPATTTTPSATASLSPTFVPSTDAFDVGSSFGESGPGGPPGEGDEPADFSEPDSAPGDAPGERRRRRRDAPEEESSPLLGSVSIGITSLEISPPVGILPETGPVEISGFETTSIEISEPSGEDPIPVDISIDSFPSLEEIPIAVPILSAHYVEAASVAFESAITYEILEAVAPVFAAVEAPLELTPREIAERFVYGFIPDMAEKLLNPSSLTTYTSLEKIEEFLTSSVIDSLHDHGLDGKFYLLIFTMRDFVDEILPHVPGEIGIRNLFDLIPGLEAIFYPSEISLIPFQHIPSTTITHLETFLNISLLENVVAWVNSSPLSDLDVYGELHLWNIVDSVDSAIQALSFYDIATTSVSEYPGLLADINNHFNISFLFKSFGTCHEEATCVNLPGSHRCDCPDGHYGDGFGPNGCADVNECDAGSHNCDVHANCTNNKGSFECECLTGFSGDGEVCTDIDECAAPDTNDCHAQATCTNTPGGYHCTCPDDYIDITGSGVLCVAQIDSCIPDVNGDGYRDHPCDINSTSLSCELQTHYDISLRQYEVYKSYFYVPQIIKDNLCTGDVIPSRPIDLESSYVTAPAPDEPISLPEAPFEPFNFGDLPAPGEGFDNPLALTDLLERGLARKRRSVAEEAVRVRNKRDHIPSSPNTVCEEIRETTNRVRARIHPFSSETVELFHYDGRFQWFSSVSCNPDLCSGNSRISCKQQYSPQKAAVAVKVGGKIDVLITEVFIESACVPVFPSPIL